MPGLATHVLAAYILKKAVSLKPLALFLLGTILPDILSRIFYILAPGLFWFVRPFHSILVIAMACLLISYLLPEAGREQAFKILLAGALLHLFLDSLQKTLSTVYPWFFPFTTQSLHIGLFWPEEPLFALPFLALISLILCLKFKNR